MQQRSILEGYDADAEEGLLASIGWPDDGYRLLEIATLAPSSEHGYFRPLAESNALFVRRSTWLELGGLDEAFDSPGGGYANLDFYRRACERLDGQLVILLGEGSFHQVHGGISTNAPPEELRPRWDLWRTQYELIRGHPFKRAEPVPLYLGTVPSSLLSTMAASLSASAIPE